MSDILARVDRVASDAIRSGAIETDTSGQFPRASIDALRDAGVLGIGLPTELGGAGGGYGDAVWAVERVARECASTAMIYCMHVSAAQVVGAFGSEERKRGVATGEELATLAFSEAGSRSHFWAPVSTAKAVDGDVQLDARKSWVTSAGEAAHYVWSSQPVAADGPSTLWLVPSDAAGLSIKGPFDGLGLRGNDSSPVTGEVVVVPESARLGDDGAGFGVMMEVVLPWFNGMSAGCSLGIAEAAFTAAAAHCSATRYAHLDSALRDLPTIRAYLARMRCSVDAGKALLADTVAAVEGGREDAMLRVLQCKAVAAETALSVTATAMRVCGGAAFRKDVGVERNMRDAQAASVMAPTTDVLYDFLGKAVTGMELF